jgi:hypothetical protein
MSRWQGGANRTGAKRAQPPRRMLVARALKNSQLTCGDVIIICEPVH